MRATEFKTVISEVKETLKGKTLKIRFQNGNKLERLSFSSLKDFGNAVLELEKRGAGFGFVSVANKYCKKLCYKPSQFPELLETGAWNEVTFLATTVKL